MHTLQAGRDSCFIGKDKAGIIGTYYLASCNCLHEFEQKHPYP